MSGTGEYLFVAWSRGGIGALLGGAARTAKLSLENAGEVVQTLAPMTPGHALAMAGNAFMRTVPPAGASDFEPNLFPTVDLAHPALPWMLSPPPDGAGRVTPWIVLVVILEQAGVAPTAGAEGRDVLTISLCPSRKRAPTAASPALGAVASLALYTRSTRGCAQ